MITFDEIKVPAGFLFAIAEAAIKKPGRKDLGLIVSETEAAMAGTFTRNVVKAAPVRLCMQKIRSGKGRVIVVNSGNANACTGRLGMEHAMETVSRVAKLLETRPSLVFPCSTGVIGTPMPMERIIPGLSPLCEGLGKASFSDVARAIMTTDTFSKMASRTLKAGGQEGIISGICKGAGMIAPNMATMLCFLITDIAVEPKTLKEALADVVERSFNRITIDGDMSTNDTVLMMANGVLGNDPVTAKSPLFKAFLKALDEVAGELARMVVRDGEGATKLIEIALKGAKNPADARRAAMSVANSKLVKTAVYGNDANWGRIMAALGYSGARFDPEKTDIYFNNVKVVKAGMANDMDREATEALKAKEVAITIDLHGGNASTTVLTCDLTEEYIKINAEYRT